MQNQDTESRRSFLDRIALGSLAIGGASLGLTGMPGALGASVLGEAAPGSGTVAREAAHRVAPRGSDIASPAEIIARAQATWDVRWPARLTGTVRTVFDVPEVESGYGVWRASIWALQYQAALGTAPADMSTALVLRHNAIVLAMRQEFWDKYGIGKLKGVTHPATLEPTDRNPALLSSTRGEVPAAYDAFALDKFLARGGVALACDLALRDCVGLIEREDGVSADEARRRAIALMVPGVILQPSGVFAVFLAQQAAGTMYIRAS